jgi:DeoR/GlpR family transcriptional regulator of sugar metabolism
VDLLRERGAVRATDLVEILGVSDVTVRRDLASLARRGVLERTHGGAVLPGGLATVVTPPEHPEQKRAIGRAAAALVRAGDTVFLNGGSTTLEVFRHLSVPATVITNNVLVALEPVDRDVDLLLLGGHVRPDPAERTVVGPFATEALRRTSATIAILGVGGLDEEHGVTTPVAAEAEIARAMVERTRERVVVVADASKLGAVADFGVCPLERVHVLVTDAVVGRAVAPLERAGLAVVLAKE